MSASNSFENAFLKLMLQNIAIAGIGDAPGLQGSASAGSTFIGLHAADPGEAGTQATSETAYPGYARVAVPRSAAGWSVTDNAFSNAAAINFPTAGAGANSTVTHFTIGVALNGATMILLSGPLSAPLTILEGIAPSFNVGQLSGTVD